MGGFGPVRIFLYGLAPTPQGILAIVNDRVTGYGYKASLFFLAKGSHAQISEKSLSCILLGLSTVIYY